MYENSWKKNSVMLSGFLFSLFLISSVSAGLCKANDGYYYDCNYNSYSNWKNGGEYYARDLENRYNGDGRGWYYKKDYNNKQQKDYQDINIIYYPVSRVYSGSKYIDLDYDNSYRKEYYKTYKDSSQNSYEKRYNDGHYYGYYRGFKKGYDLGYDDGWNKRDKKLIFESVPEYLVYKRSERYYDN